MKTFDEWKDALARSLHTRAHRVGHTEGFREGWNKAHALIEPARFAVPATEAAPVPVIDRLALVPTLVYPVLADPEPVASEPPDPYLEREYAQMAAQAAAGADPAQRVGDWE